MNSYSVVSPSPVARLFHFQALACCLVFQQDSPGPPLSPRTHLYICMPSQYLKRTFPHLRKKLSIILTRLCIASLRTLRPPPLSADRLPPPPPPSIRALHHVRPTVADADAVDGPPPPPLLIATGAVAASVRPANPPLLAAATPPSPALSFAAGTSALALLLHAASGEGGEDADVRAQVAPDGSVVISFGGVQAAAAQLTCRLQAHYDPLSLSSLLFEFSFSSSSPLPLQPHTALAVAAVASGGALAPAAWARAFVQRMQQCCALHAAILDETHADTERNLYQIAFSDSAGASAFTLFILPHSRSGVALQPLALLLPVTYPHVSPQPSFSSASSHLRSCFLTLMQQHSQPWPVSLMVLRPPAPTFSSDS
jgi:hypothetical protein